MEYWLPCSLLKVLTTRMRTRATTCAAVSYQPPFFPPHCGRSASSSPRLLNSASNKSVETVAHVASVEITWVRTAPESTSREENEPLLCNKSSMVDVQAIPQRLF